MSAAIDPAPESEIRAFEAGIEERLGVRNAVAMSSETAALHLGLVALGVGPDDSVVTSTLAFAGAANAITHCGARPVFVDVEEETGTMDPALLRIALQRLRESDSPVGAIVPVDICGAPADHASIIPIADEFAVPVLIDAAESFGTAPARRARGSFGDAAVFSFGDGALLDASGGGMLVTDDAEVAARAARLAAHSRSSEELHEQVEVGFDCRMSPLVAALGRRRLARLDAMIERRAGIRRRYDAVFALIPGVRILGRQSLTHAGRGEPTGHVGMSAIVVDPTVAGWRASDLGAWLATAGIASRPIWRPMHTQPAFIGERVVLDGTAERLHATTLLLPDGSAEDGADVERVIREIRAFLGEHAYSES